ncbi:glycosyltransferase [Geminocystis sp. NIES-3708]|uniref:glycosyltransferase family 4 protein n=1 Tax=Geminocystis sp. NIES-3708 TaxID=1615909 RepID=UPI0005FC503B|nr:glycosyltransferase family 4 protein [Geminocystis sp. NIES-3708]BAQ59699.1 glycosyltransferase [Geminocystis sp. NIES-3708]
MSKIKVGFLSAHNYFDYNTSSGTPYRMYKALKNQNIEIINLGYPHKVSFWEKLKKRLLNPSLSVHGNLSENIVNWQNFGKLIEKQLRNKPCDIIFAPFASREVAFLETNIPIIYSSDITFKLLQNYYRSDFSANESKWREKIELDSINKSRRLVYPSQWAAQSAINDYQAPLSKISIVAYGANLDNPPKTEEVLQRRKSLSPCRLLFIGKDWQRKGGDIAVETLNILNSRGFNTSLTMVGSVPPSPIDNDKLTIIPFLDKNSPTQRQKFNQLFWDCNLFIFPTRADCSPISICEANAFGLPVISSNVGGIPDIVTEGKNGYLIDISATPEDYANSIEQLIKNPHVYEELIINSRNEYETKLNWDKWAEQIYVICSLFL